MPSLYFSVLCSLIELTRVISLNFILEFIESGSMILTRPPHPEDIPKGRGGGGLGMDGVGEGCSKVR